MRFIRCACLLICVATHAAFALDPTEILMIANGNSPVSKELAEYYAQKRNVPLANLVLVHVDSHENISRENYRDQIAKPVKAFLDSNDPEHKIKCLLTFDGVPLKIDDRSSTPEQKEELGQIKEDQKTVMPNLLKHVQEVEQIAQKLDPTYKPPTDLQVLPALSIRVDRAVERILQNLNAEADEKVRRAVLERLFDQIDPLTGPSGRLQRVMFKDLPLSTTEPATSPATSPSSNPTTEPVAATQPDLPEDRKKQLMLAQKRMTETNSAVQQLGAHQDNPAARVQLRNIVRDQLGVLNLAKVLESQEEQLATSETGAAVDNELALVLWGNEYGLYRWIENPLYFRFARRMAGAPPVMMVMRLDGPDDMTAKGIINASIEAERVGLTGKIVIDSRGMAAQNPNGSVQSYGEYDETLRNLNKLLKEKANLPVVFDDHDAVLRPGSVRDVALYVGWYAVRNYIPSCSFVRGAVGYHVASLEMISLKAAGEKGWCAGLLNDGIASTLGAVNEPYLHSFPKADEFFPLLLTGKLTLAEVYWRTNPLASWQICMIGDPLYTPFKVNPGLKIEDLPTDLQRALELPTTRPLASNPSNRR